MKTENNSTCRRMYYVDGLTLEVGVAQEAQTNALKEGKSLSEYINDAVAEANARKKK